MEVRFVFKSSSGKPRIHSKRLPVLVGRSDADDVKLRIPKDAVSRRHCEFFLDDTGRVCVRDLESTNGTFLDGRQLEPRVAAAVPSGCAVKLGNVGFRVEYQAAAGAASAHDSDTIPIEAATAPVEVDELEPVGPEQAAGVAQTERLGDAGPVAGLDEPVAADGFGFLAGADADAPEAEPWPQVDDAPASSDTGLDDFLKGLP